MWIRLGKGAIGVLTAAALVLILAWVADLGALDASRIRPAFALGTLFALAGTIIARASVLRSLAPAADRSKGDWLRVAARHQLAFVLAPSGTGDAAFPFLAGRYLDLPTGDAVRVIAQFRIRDAILLCFLGACGALSLGLGAHWMAPALLAMLLALCFVEEICRSVFRAVGAMLPRGRASALLAQVATGAPPSRRQRATRLALALASWLSSGIAMWYAFAAVGRELSAGEVMLMLAGLNLAGLFATTIAGLGFVEAGVAGVLMALGDKPDAAAAVALIARPLLLVGMVAASGLVDLAVSLLRRSASGAARQ